jgi:hypothetical protein
MLKYAHIVLPEYLILQVNRGGCLHENNCSHDNFAIVHNKAIISMVGHA